MENIFSLFYQYGLFAVFVSVLVEQLGAPIPAIPFLLLAGVASASNAVFAVQALAVAAVASMLADSLWFFAGKRFGRKVLALLCRISISPDSCVRQSELNFARRGVATLVIAKFVPGLSTLASPLAGAIGMRTSSFLLFNLAGTLLWAGSGIAAGLIFHDQVGLALEYLNKLGKTAILLGAAILGLYIAGRAVRRWLAARAVANLPRVKPAELADLIEQGEELIVIDVRAAVTQPFIEDRIPGACHIELAIIETFPVDDWPKTARIITYCSCPNDVSALKAAHLLSKRGLEVSILLGGIEGWVAAGYPLASASPETVA